MLLLIFVRDWQIIVKIKAWTKTRLRIDAKVFMDWFLNNNCLFWEKESKWWQSQRLPRMVNNASLQTEIISDIWNISITDNGGTVTNVGNSQTKNVGTREHNSSLWWASCSDDILVWPTVIRNLEPSTSIRIKVDKLLPYSYGNTKTVYSYKCKIGVIY